ncbi:hypothetical protein OG329_31450 [Streptomyces sp. NBC_01506]
MTSPTTSKKRSGSAANTSPPGYRLQPGITDDAQAAAWRPTVQRAHAAGARIVLRLMHFGALAQGNRFRDRPAGPSAVRPRGERPRSQGHRPYRGGQRTPHQKAVARRVLDEGHADILAIGTAAPANPDLPPAPEPGVRVSPARSHPCAFGRGLQPPGRLRVP